jgi:hypothetical protein
MLPRLRITFAAAAFLLFSGCAVGPDPAPSIAPDATPTLDGLYPVDNSVLQFAEVRRDIDLSGYTAFMLSPVEVAYQKDPGQRSPGSPEANFALSAREMESFKESFQTEVRRALTENDGYELVDEPGPNVLRLDAHLIDLVVRVNNEATAGRNRSFTSSYGEVTMILELYDSQSGQILARAAERADPTRSTYEVVEVRPALVRADVSRLFRHWAVTVRERLDALRSADLTGGGA